MAKKRTAPPPVASGPDFVPAMNRVDFVGASGYAVIYARYSSHAQRDASIEQQVRDCLDYAARNNIYVVACYADRHLTGRSDRRPEFHRMLRDVETGGWDYVLVWKNDRFARNRYDAAIYKAKLRKAGVRCLYSQEYIPAGPEGILLEAMLEGDAEFRSAQMAVDIKRGLAYNASRCMVTGAVPYGYTRGADYRLEIDPDRAAVVRELFDRFLAGWKYVDMAADLNARGITTARGTAWGRNSFHAILKNERYTGVYIYGDTRVEGGVPAIIDRDTWLAAQHRLHTKKNPVGRSRSVADYLLTGKLFCGRCASPMVGISGTGKMGEKYYYYVCQGRRVAHSCKKENAPKAWVEDMVCQYVMDLVLQQQVIEWMADCVVDYQRRHRDDGTVRALSAQLAQVQAARKNVMAAIEAGIFTASTKDRLLELEAQEKKLAGAIATEKAIRPTYARERIVFWLEQFRGGDIHDRAFREKLVTTFVNAVYLFDDHIRIALNYSGRNSSVDLPLVEKAGAAAGPGGSYSVVIGPPNSSGTNSAALYFVAPVFVLVAGLKEKAAP